PRSPLPRILPAPPAGSALWWSSGTRGPFAAPSSSRGLEHLTAQEPPRDQVLQSSSKVTYETAFGGSIRLSGYETSSAIKRPRSTCPETALLGSPPRPPSSRRPRQRAAGPALR